MTHISCVRRTGRHWATSLVILATPVGECLAQNQGSVPDQPGGFGSLGAASLRLGFPLRTRTQASKPGTGQVVLQLLAGLAGAWIGGLAGYQLVAAIADDRTVEGDTGYSPAGNVGFVVGSALGSATLSTIVGGLQGTEGSYAGALAGGAIPTGLLLFGLHEPYLGPIGAVFVAPLQSGGAYLGYRHFF